MLTLELVKIKASHPYVKSVTTRIISSGSPVFRWSSLLLPLTEIMHASNNVLGYLHTMDVILFDLLPSCFKIICLHCNKEMIDRKMMFNDHSWRKNCESCHNASSAKIERYY